jgi:cytochrome c peroxidase
MRVAKQTQCCVALMLACLAAGGCTSSTGRADRHGATRQTTLKAPPIPKAGVLAQPKSLRQIGLPDGAILAAIPPDNPQTPEKIALGQKLFFDGRLSAVPVTIPPALSPTGGPFRSVSMATSASATRRLF